MIQFNIVMKSFSYTPSSKMETIPVNKIIRVVQVPSLIYNGVNIPILSIEYEYSGSKGVKIVNGTLDEFYNEIKKEFENTIKKMSLDKLELITEDELPVFSKFVNADEIDVELPIMVPVYLISNYKASGRYATFDLPYTKNKVFNPGNSLINIIIRDTKPITEIFKRYLK